jgi:hypothetical protein
MCDGDDDDGDSDRDGDGDGDIDFNANDGERLDDRKVCVRVTSLYTASASVSAPAISPPNCAIITTPGRMTLVV